MLKFVCHISNCKQYKREMEAYKNMLKDNHKVCDSALPEIFRCAIKGKIEVQNEWPFLINVNSHPYKVLGGYITSLRITIVTKA